MEINFITHSVYYFTAEADGWSEPKGRWDGQNDWPVSEPAAVAQCKTQYIIHSMSMYTILHPITKLKQITIKDRFALLK